MALRALGPSLTQFGILNALPDPTLTLYNGNGTAIAANDNWQQTATQAGLISSYQLAPPSNLDAALALSLPPGSYTAILAGKNNQTGVALVEIYDMQ